MPDQTSEPAIRIEHLDNSFGEGEAAKQVLFDINLEVAPGEFVIMTGPSGSGKTTLLGLVGALRRPQAGTITVAGPNRASSKSEITAEASRFISIVCAPAAAASCTKPAAG